jgi:hypothetical protein
MLFWLIAVACSTEYTVVIPKAMMQQRIAEKFPIEKGDRALAHIQLRDPVLQLPGGDRLQIDTHITATVPDLDAVAIPAPSVEEGASTTARAADVLLRMGQAALQVAAVPREELSGTLGVTGTLHYSPDEGAFYLTEPTISRLQLDGEPEEQVQRLRAVAELGVDAVLSRLPVYTLDHDIQQRASRMLLKEIRVEPDGLQITLGL